MTSTPIKSSQIDKIPKMAMHKNATFHANQTTKKKK